jgi:hypothetical protein
VYDSTLYAAGIFDTIGGVQASDIAYWDGAKWNAADIGISGGEVYSLMPFMSELYAGGIFSYAGTVPVNNIASY